jgi:hypothetical protein
MFPRGKINRDEGDLACAIREVGEEIGFDITPHVDEKRFIEVMNGEKRNRLYVVLGVPKDTPFLTRTRKEIYRIGWHRIEDLPRPNTPPPPKPIYFNVSQYVPRLLSIIQKVAPGKVKRCTREGILIVSEMNNMDVPTVYAPPFPSLDPVSGKLTFESSGKGASSSSSKKDQKKKKDEVRGLLDFQFDLREINNAFK